MTESKILELARQAGLQLNAYAEAYPVIAGQLATFARLVAEAEREECAKVCDHYAGLPHIGDAEAGAADGAEFLAYKIRSRTE